MNPTIINAQNSTHNQKAMMYPAFHLFILIKFKIVNNKVDISLKYCIYRITKSTLCQALKLNFIVNLLAKHKKMC